MFINISNHPSEYWNTEQTAAAEQYGEIVDLPFPAVDPGGDEAYIQDLADQYYKKISEYPDPTVMLQGEFTFVFCLASRLVQANITVLAACSERKVTVVQKEDGTEEKRSQFTFVRFRRYVN